MTKDEINRYIHEEIMGQCWHDIVSLPTFRCVGRCKEIYDGLRYYNYPDYCSDASPRSLLNAVVLKLHPPGGCSCQYGDISFCALQVDAKASGIAQICVLAHQQGSASQHHDDARPDNAAPTGLNETDG